MTFGTVNIAISSKRWKELDIANRTVNSTHLVQKDVGQRDNGGVGALTSERDCKASALTKRHELLAGGWPSRSLLLSEVVLLSGEHHLVLVVHVKDGDFVLDNLDDQIHSVAATYRYYRWLRIQSPENPKFWTGVKDLNALQALSSR